MTVAGMAGTGIAIKSFKNADEERKELLKELESYEKYLFVAGENLEAGDTVTSEKVRRMLRYSDEESILYMTEEDFGKVLLAPVTEGSCIRKKDLTEEEENLREVLITEVDIPEYLKEGNRVDVRISFANAEDYVVLAEKVLVRCEKKTGIVLRLSEEEILLLSSARYDCDTYRDTELYLVKYPEEQRQEKSPVAYLPDEIVLKMLEREKEVTKRRELESRQEKNKR